jgi:hypothetical protein
VRLLDFLGSSLALCTSASYSLFQHHNFHQTSINPIHCPQTSYQFLIPLPPFHHSTIPSVRFQNPISLSPSDEREHHHALNNRFLGDELRRATNPSTQILRFEVRAGKSPNYIAVECFWGPLSRDSGLVRAYGISLKISRQYALWDS